jgi:hypothetical protein
LKGEWKQSTLPSITFNEPTDAIDIMDLLGSMNAGGEGDF